VIEDVRRDGRSMRQISLADAGTRHSRISLADDSGPSEDSRVRHAAGGGKGKSSSAFFH
jgi:hypothetical protein